MKQQYHVIPGFVMLCPRIAGGYPTNHVESMQNDDQPPDRLSGDSSCGLVALPSHQLKLFLPFPVCAAET